MFLPCPGEPIMPFDMWLRMFDNYLLAINAVGSAWPDARKRATLLHCLGVEGQRIFYALPDTVDDMIRDQLLEHLQSDDIRQRLLLEPDLTLQKATNLATQLEAAAEHAKRMTADRDAPVRAVQVKSHHARGKHCSRPAAAPASSARKSCFRCGSDKHLANSAHCPAAKVHCKLCNKKGHFTRVCRSAPASDVREVQVHDVTVLYLEKSAETPKKLHCNVTVSTPAASPGTTVQFVVDTGSSVSILPTHIYKRHFSATQLSTPAIRLVTCTQECIPVLGCLQAQVRVSNASAVATFFFLSGVK
ncbi:hypothetical protein DPX16_21823 [Anabarilius grahami]|uniref:CCHC-type domain-containing protein n=1 Tax=Anabarilius grahami TaxID=495550 RepID=A0A3N0YQ65_ANAGA|nr:hypothetical protein DPX16_21823 [Anabarilius grahami]